MAFSSARRTTAALVVTLSGAALAACGAHVAHTAAVDPPTSASPSTSSPAPAASSASGSPSATVSAPQSASASPFPSSPSAPASASGTPSATDQNSDAKSGAPSGSAPAGNLLVSPALLFSAGGTGKTVALTFDDGPDPRWTPQVLALLAQHHVKATFCEIGPNAQRYPYLTRAIVSAGHRLCDHSVHHDEQQSHKSVDYNTHEIVDAQHMIQTAAGPSAKIWYYRAPGGDFSPSIRNIAAQRGLRPLAWSADSDDWKRPGVPGILQNINKDLRPGAVVLMHDGGGDRSQTVQALALLLDQLDAQGYTYTFPGA